MIIRDVCVKSILCTLGLSDSENFIITMIMNTIMIEKEPRIRGDYYTEHFIGVTVDERLSFNEHINRISSS